MFAHALAQLLQHEHPKEVVSDMSKQLRTGKVFVDWSQNDEHKTTVAVYSLRAREHPTVSTPLKWEEVESAIKKKDASLLVFEAPQVVSRFEKLGDLFEPVLELKQKLPTIKELMPAAEAEKTERIDLAAQAEAEEAEAPRRKTAKKARPSRRKV
jgi:bifunctional non-homologous end joining protein LigD